MNPKNWDDPTLIEEQYRSGKQYKSGLGKRGLYEQNKVNERFYLGDQWHGVNCGSDKPLVRQNIIKRIGDYKMAVIGSSPLTVNYSADGIPSTLDTQQQIQQMRGRLSREQANGTVPEGLTFPGTSTGDEVNLVMSALSDYFKVTAERVGLETLKETALKNAYMFGTGLLYTYWDDRVKTGLYSDAQHKAPITGDIGCEVLDVENVYFGDPNCDDVQAQPYILIAQRKTLGELRRMMKQNGQRRHIAELRPDTVDVSYHAGGDDGGEAADSRKATLITKLYKEWDDEGRTYRIRAVQVCGQVVVRPPWDLGIRRYPLAKFCWERRKNCAYGESEITYLIPNQIAINRMMTASVWAVMMMGIPIMVVNGDVISEKMTNDPGQVIRVFGSGEDVDRAIRYVQPPQFSPRFGEIVNTLITQTMSQAGANDAALGNMRPDNTSAIIALREAAALPLQSMQNRFYAFIEDVARIWADFWIMHYGRRALKIEDETGTWYLPFDGSRYRDMVVCAQVDVGASSLWSEVESVQTLDNLFKKDVLTVEQYLSRLPKGIIPNLNGLIRELKQPDTPDADAAPPLDDTLAEGLSPQAQEVWQSMSEQAKRAALAAVM